MYRKIVLIILFTILLAACGQEVKADVPDTPEAQAAQALVEKYMAVNINYDAEGLLALYAEDVFWMDYGIDDGPLSKGDLNYFVREVMPLEEFKMEFTSYLVTTDGQFAVVEGSYAEISPLSGKWVAAPFVLVLEFKDGLIIREEWYYNASIFH